MSTTGVPSSKSQPRNRSSTRPGLRHNAPHALRDDLSNRWSVQSVVALAEQVEASSKRPRLRGSAKDPAGA